MAATPSQTTPTTSSAPAAPVAAGAAAVAGTWSGKYSGAFNGTFTLNWQASGSNLSGTIKLSTAGTFPINGTLQGNAINFGTLGSVAITYTGSVSGSSMSGSYTVRGAGGGDWSASKTG